MGFRTGVLHLPVVSFSGLVLCVVTSTVDIDLFLKQEHLHELGVQIQQMRKELYANCQNVFQGISSTDLIGRRSSLDTSLDLKIKLAKTTLDDLIMMYGNCSSTKPFVTNMGIGIRTQYATPKQGTSLPASSATLMTMETLHTTRNHVLFAFTVLRSKNVTYQGYNFLALEVQIPSDGLSKSSNWCLDYQNMCEDFSRRPTGCGNSFRSVTGYSACREKYNSDMDIDDTLGCNPSVKIAQVSNLAFPDLTSPVNKTNAFGFHYCLPSNCQRTIQESEEGVSYLSAFWESNITVFYTVCH